MKKLFVLIWLSIACFACDSLDDWTTKDVLNDGGTDSETSSRSSDALVNKDTAPWAGDCMDQLDAWIAGNVLPGDGCYWGTTGISCDRMDYGEMYCVDNKVNIKCPEGDMDDMLDAAADRCNWQITGTIPTDSEMPAVWRDCHAAADAFEAGAAFPGEACTFEASGCGGTSGLVWCEDGKLWTNCGTDSDPASADWMKDSASYRSCSETGCDDTDTTDTICSDRTWTECEVALAAWLAGNAQPGDACSWSPVGWDGMWCQEEIAYGAVRCVDGKIQIDCVTRILTEPGEQCNAQMDSDSDSTNLVWSSCEETWNYWIAGVAKAGDACSWSSNPSTMDGFCHNAEFGEIFCNDNGQLVMHCEVGIGGDTPQHDVQCDWQMHDTDTDTDTGSDGPVTDCMAAYDAWTAGEIFAGAACDFSGSLCGRQTGTVTCVHGALQTNCSGDTDPGSTSWMTENDTGCGFWTDCDEALTAWIGGAALPGDPCAWDVAADGYGNCMEPGYGVMACSAGTGLTVTCPVTAESGDLRWLTSPSEVCEWQETDTETDIDTDTTPVSWSDCQTALYAAMNFWEARPGDDCTFPDGTLCGDQLFGWVYCEDYKLRMNCDYMDTDFDSPNAYTEPDQLCPIE